MQKIGQGGDQHNRTESRSHGKATSTYVVHKGYDILKSRYRPCREDFRHMVEDHTYIK